MDEQSFAPVSVVIPCYRCTETIERAVTSVYSQTWRPAEVILVDDASSDATLDNLHSLAGKYPEGWIKVSGLLRNSGPGTARNLGWERAKQTYIAFLDADDSWHPEKIEIQTRWMLNNVDVALTGHACAIASNHTAPNSSSFNQSEVQFKQVSPRQLLLSNRFPTRSVMLKRELRHRFADGKYHSEDFLLWCEICLDGNRCLYATTCLAFRYKGEYGQEGLSKDLWKMELGQLDSYRRLYSTSRIGLLAYQALFAWSLLRYIRREIRFRLGLSSQ